MKRIWDNSKSKLLELRKRGRYQEGKFCASLVFGYHEEKEGPQEVTLMDIKTYHLRSGGSAFATLETLKSVTEWLNATKPTASLEKGNPVGEDRVREDIAIFLKKPKPSQTSSPKISRNTTPPRKEHLFTGCQLSGDEGSVPW